MYLANRHPEALMLTPFSPGISHPMVAKPDLKQFLLRKIDLSLACLADKIQVLPDFF